MGARRGTGGIESAQAYPKCTRRTAKCQEPATIESAQACPNALPRADFVNSDTLWVRGLNPACLFERHCG